MSVRRVGQRVFDWAQLASKVPEEAKAEFGAFRARHEACRTSLAAYSEKPETIDWNFYKRNISLPGFVDSFQKQFEALKIPLPKDTASAAIEEQKKKNEVDALKVIEETKASVIVLEKELAAIKSQKPFEEMTIDEYLADKPDLRRQIDADTRNQNWYLGKD